MTTGINHPPNQSSLAAYLRDSNQLRVDAIISQMKEMSDDQRLEIIGSFCRHCGCDNPQCQCWNDE